MVFAQHVSVCVANVGNCMTQGKRKTGSSPGHCHNIGRYADNGRELSNPPVIATAAPYGTDRPSRLGIDHGAAAAPGTALTAALSSSHWHGKLNLDLDPEFSGMRCVTRRCRRSR